jgi:DNA ligase D-like protein (predicted ligase)
MVQRVLRTAKPRPRFIEPMECMRVPKLPEGDGWLYEIKQDGYRAIAVVDASTVLLYSMSGLDYTQQFPHIAFALKNLRRGNLIMDGEIVALDEQGRASFQELQNRKSTPRPIVYYVFDLLHLKGTDLFNLPLQQRQKMLSDVGSRFLDPLRLNPTFRTPLPRLTEQVKRLGLEGIVAKQASSVYTPGKESSAWQKYRFNQEGEFVVGGYVAAGRSFSSLIVGEYRGKDLYYIKRVAAGFTPHLRDEVFVEIKALKTPLCPFLNLPEPKRSSHGLSAEKMRECVWLKPERRCELEFVERTRGGRLRHAVFRRLLG